jgi:glycosyltransferase involved in cell wall biosynthesis
MIAINALATRAGGAAVRIAEVARRAPGIWRQPVLLVRNREVKLDLADSAERTTTGWPWLLERAPAVPRRVFEAAVLRHRLRDRPVSAILHYGTYVPLRPATGTLNVLCFISLAPWDPGPDSQSRRNRLLRWLFERTHHRADLIIVQSEATRALLEELYPDTAGRMAVVRNGLSLPALARPEQTRGFLVLGDIYAYRRIGDVVRAHARLPPELRALHPLTIAGNPARDSRATAEVRAAIEEAGPGVELAGLVPRARALGMIAASRAFISFATVENGPNAVAEAAAIGTPLVLSDIPPHREFGGPNARFAADVAGLASAMQDAAAGAGPRLSDSPGARGDTTGPIDSWDEHVARIGALLAQAGALTDSSGIDRVLTDSQSMQRPSGAV